MGLDFIHEGATFGCCPQWAYELFGQFRERLAAAEGIDLRGMWGFGGFGNWDSAGSDLRPLLDHADDRGHLTAAECAQVFPRLRQIALAWDPNDPNLDYDRRSGLALADCMETCAKAGTRLEFC